MDREQIFNTLKGILDEWGFDTANMTMSSGFQPDLGLDSLGSIELVVAVEEAFGIDIPDVDAETLKTVGDVVSYIERRVGKEK